MNCERLRSEGFIATCIMATRAPEKPQWGNVGHIGLQCLRGGNLGFISENQDGHGLRKGTCFKQVGYCD